MFERLQSLFTSMREMSALKAENAQLREENAAWIALVQDLNEQWKADAAQRKADDAQRAQWRADDAELAQRDAERKAARAQRDAEWAQWSAQNDRDKAEAARWNAENLH